jgi:peptide chain release factor 2
MVNMNFQEAEEKLDKISLSLAELRSILDIDSLQKEIAELGKLAENPALWENQENAQKVTQKLSAKQGKLEQYKSLSERISDAKTMLELLHEENEIDISSTRTVKDLSGSNKTNASALLAELSVLSFEIVAIEKILDKLEVSLLLNQKYDSLDAVLSIKTGAGGVDAADFSQMLLRMYIRWAESNGYKATILESSDATEAGIKSATVEIKGNSAFGKLSMEAGTHRLVRISPFNAQGKRQTSFSAVEVIPLLEDTKEVEVDEKDIKVDVFRSSGPGGQSVNTTDSAVRITHIPTGIVVSMQNEKSQLQNKAYAMKILKSKLLLLKQESERVAKRELAGDITASWGNQIRNYVLHPYKIVKDLRTGHEETNVQSVLDGNINGFLDSGIRYREKMSK